MKELIDRIHSSKNFLVTSHINPDGDNVGSSVAMTKFLKNIGKNAIHGLNDQIPDNLNFLMQDHKIYMEKEEILAYFGEKDFDLIILDSAEKSRVALDSEIIEKAQTRINIDHHMSNSQYGDINYVEAEVSSSCEVLTRILLEIDEEAVTKEVATAAYTGISTDTGNFMFPAVTAETFRTAAILTEKGADRTLIANEIYRNTSLEIRKLTKLLLDTFTIVNQVGIMTMSKEMLEVSGVDYKDTEAVTNLGVDTKGVEIGILIKENGPDLYKISLRSKGYANVCEIAAIFGGGGHHNAAGCTIEGPLEEVKDQLQKSAEAQLEKDLTNA